MKTAALHGALSDRARAGRIHVVSALVDGDVPSTRRAVASVARLTTRRHVLVVALADDAVTSLSLRNVPTIHFLTPGQLNTYDVMVSDDVVFTAPALEAFASRSVTMEEK
jgi:large subunit ribosomal protein L4